MQKREMGPVQDVSTPEMTCLARNTPHSKGEQKRVEVTIYRGGVRAQGTNKGRVRKSLPLLGLQ